MRELRKVGTLTFWMKAVHPTDLQKLVVNVHERMCSTAVRKKEPTNFPLDDV